jgi:hypothetical protein
VRQHLLAYQGYRGFELSHHALRVILNVFEGAAEIEANIGIKGLLLAS